MLPRLDPLDRALLDGLQRDLPVVPRPYQAIGRALGLDEAEVIARLARLAEVGAISRVGGTCRPNTAGASTLAAIAAPDDRIEEVAAIVGAEEGVNHSYLRENRWNLWFVATGPDRAHVEATLARLRAPDRPRGARPAARAPVQRRSRLRARRPVAAAAAARGGPGRARARGPADPAGAVATGSRWCPRPYAALAAALGRPEAEVLVRIRALLAAGLIGRLGVIVRHRALGWTANAMVVWQVPEADDRRRRARRSSPSRASRSATSACRPAPSGPTRSTA